MPTEFDLRGGTLQFGLNSASPIAPTSAMLLDPANYRLQQVTQGANKTDNQEKAARFDLTYDPSEAVPFITSIDTGLHIQQSRPDPSGHSEHSLVS